jgi:hypothetical protein
MVEEKTISVDFSGAPGCWHLALGCHALGVRVRPARLVADPGEKVCTTAHLRLHTRVGCRPKRAGLQHHTPKSCRPALGTYPSERVFSTASLGPAGLQDPTLLAPSWACLAAEPNILGSGCATIPKDIGSKIFTLFFDFYPVKRKKIDKSFFILYKSCVIIIFFPLKLCWIFSFKHVFF